MPVLVPVAALRKGSVTIEGSLDVQELDLGLSDPCIAVRQPLHFELTAELMEEEVLVQGALDLVLNCNCVRCLEPFETTLRIEPWSTLVAISGPDASPMVDEAVDLTPQIREDTLLALPQHPACRPECRGLPSQSPDSTKPQSSSDQLRRTPSAWSVLDRLKLD